LYDPVRRLPCFDFLDNGLDEGLLLGVIGKFEVGAVELRNGLPEASLDPTQVVFEEAVGIYASLSVDKLDEEDALGYSHFTYNGLVAFKEFFFKAFFVGFVVAVFFAEAGAFGVDFINDAGGFSGKGVNKVYIAAQALEVLPLAAHFGLVLGGGRLGYDHHFGQDRYRNAIRSHKETYPLGPSHRKEYANFSYLCVNMALAHTRIYGQDSPLPHTPEGRPYKAYIETYGCQMNFADSELVAGLLHQEGYSFTTRAEEADLILINTCAIREHAEEKIWQRLRYLENIKAGRPHLMVGVIGCMAERLRQRLFEESFVVDIVMGPDSYRHLPHLIRQVGSGAKAIHTLLSREETYADIAPLRLSPNKVSAYLSIMRGCNNMCTFCIVPFTRGRERSRPHQSILQEIIQLSEAGYKEITLLGQNVDSYNDNGLRFAQLLRLVAEAVPNVWIRFATSHPKDMLDEVLETIAAYPNLSPYIHLPIQSGSNRVLARMNRGYTVEWYLERIAAIRRYLPNVVISTDIIVGFCGETEEDFQETLAAMRAAAFDSGYYFMYSERPGTLAARRYKDDVPPEVKKERLEKVIALAQALSLESNRQEIGRVHPVLLEKVSRRSSKDLTGRTFHGKAVVVRGIACTHQPGDKVFARIIDATSATLIAELANASAVGAD